MPDMNCDVAPSLVDLSHLIAGLPRETVRSFTPASPDQISSFEEAFGLRLPHSYKQLVLTWGALCCDSWHILGIGQDVPDELQVAGTLLGLRIECPDIDPALAPIEDLGDGTLACLSCTDGTVQRLQYGEQGQVTLVQLAQNLAVYLRGRLTQTPGDDLDSQWKRLAQHVADFHGRTKFSHVEGGKLPESYKWRPYRYCVQDVMLGAIVLRHARTRNYLEVDVWLTDDSHEDFPSFHGGRGLLSFALTEAFHCGGSMEIAFTKGIPQSFKELAKAMDVTLSGQSVVSAEESKALYMKLAGFSGEFASFVLELQDRGILQSERACYLVSRGVWTKAELEALVRSSSDPNRILSGGVSVLYRQLFLEDLNQGRGAVLGGQLDRTLSYRAEDVDREDNVRPLIIQFDPTRYGKVYLCQLESVPIPQAWCASEDSGKEPISAGTRFEVLVRAREASDIAKSWTDDMEMADGCEFLLYPQDFLELGAGLRTQIVVEALKRRVTVLVGPEPIASLDSDVLRRFENSRLVRQ